MNCFERNKQPFAKRQNTPFGLHFSTSSDKVKWQRQNCLQETVGKIDLKFSIVFVDLVRTLHCSVGVKMIQTTKCSQEDKLVWLLVVVF